MAIFLALAALLVAAPAPADADADQNCTLTRAGDVYCSGGAQPVRVHVSGKVVQLAASGDSTCALTEPGEVYCWPAGEAPAGEAPAGEAPAGEAAVGEAAAGSSDLGFNPLLLISLGLALVGAGCTLVRLSSGQGATSRAASRHRSAPSLSRSA